MKPMPTSPESLRLLAAGLRAAATAAADEAAAEAAGAAVAARVAATVVATAWLAAGAAEFALFPPLLLLLLQPAIARPKRPAPSDAVPRTNRRREIGRQYRSAIALSSLCHCARHRPARRRCIPVRRLVAAVPLPCQAWNGASIASAPSIVKKRRVCAARLASETTTLLAKRNSPGRCPGHAAQFASLARETCSAHLPARSRTVTAAAGGRSALSPWRRAALRSALPPRSAFRAVARCHWFPVPRSWGGGRRS